MSWTPLQQELIEDPAGLNYADSLVNYDEATLLTLLNDTPVMAPTAGSMHSERGVLDLYPDGPIAADAVLSKVEAFAQSNHGLASIVSRALKFLGQSEGIDFGAASTQALLKQLGAFGIITPAEASKLAALGMTTGTRAAQLGFGAVTSDQLYAAVFDGHRRVAEASLAMRQAALGGQA